MTTVTSALLRMPAASARWPVGDLREAAGKPGATRFAGAVEIEEQTAYAARGAAVEHGLGGLRGVDHRDAAAARPENIEALEQHGVVRAIEARLHDDEAFDAARCGAAGKRVERSGQGEIGPGRHLRISRDRADDMDVAVATHRLTDHSALIPSFLTAGPQ